MTDESLEVTERSTHEIGVDEDIEDKDKKIPPRFETGSKSLVICKLIRRIS